MQLYARISLETSCISMSHTKRLLKGMVWTVAFCTAVVTCAAQEKDAIQSSSPTQAATPPSSDSSQLEVAPGVSLPTKGMVWILDQVENKPQLARIYVSEAHANSHIAENLVRAQFLVLKMSGTIDLPGTAAKFRVNSRSPAIFVRKSDEDEEESQSPGYAKRVGGHYVLLRLRIAGERRLVCTFSSYQLG